jgi:hypothetical protein
MKNLIYHTKIFIASLLMMFTFLVIAQKSDVEFTYNIDGNIKWGFYL